MEKIGWEAEWEINTFTSKLGWDKENLGGCK